MNRLAFFVLFFNLLLQSCLKDNPVTYQAQLKLDTLSIRAFLKDNNISATKIEPGVWYEVDTVGIGIYPVLSDSIKISYTTQLIPTLREVGDTTSNALLSATISGMQLALPHFPARSFGKLYISSGLAFGASVH